MKTLKSLIGTPGFGPAFQSILGGWGFEASESNRVRFESWINDEKNNTTPFFGYRSESWYPSRENHICNRRMYRDFGSFLTSNWLVGTEAAVYIIPSMGASAVLLFAIPHSPLAQPWNVFGGHIISAAVGVIWAQFG